MATKQENIAGPGTTLFDAPDVTLTGVITMSCKKTLSQTDQKWLDEFSVRFERALAKRPTVSDEEFMAETEVSDEQYAIGLTLPGVRDHKGGKNG